MAHYSRIMNFRAMWPFFRKPGNARIFAFGMLGFLSAGSLTFAQSSERFDDAFRKLKRNDNLQFELPVPPPKEPPKDRPDWLQAIMDFFENFFSFLAPFLELIFYGLLAVVVLTIVYFIVRELGLIRRPQRKDPKPVEAEAIPLYAPDQNEARVLLESVDALAAAGKFEEAVHTLLFRSIQDIDLKRPNTIRRSLTSREIASLDILTRDARDAFSLIGKVVEDSYFGGRPLGMEDFQRCRAAYEQFAIPKAWAA